jgi:hypothetical protein
MKKVCIANYLYVLIIILVFTVSTAFSQVKVIHFNAGWNEANDVEWFDKLSDAGKKSLNIDDTKIQKKYAIAIVPTIIVFDDGEEVKRFQADLSFKMVAKAGKQQKKDLKKAKKSAKLEQKARFKRGDITRKRFKDIKKEIRKYKDY